MNVLDVESARDILDSLVSSSHITPIIIKGTKGNAILVSEEDWKSVINQNRKNTCGTESGTLLCNSITSYGD